MRKFGSDKRWLGERFGRCRSKFFDQSQLTLKSFFVKSTPRTKGKTPVAIIFLYFEKLFSIDSRTCHIFFLLLLELFGVVGDVRDL